MGDRLWAPLYRYRRGCIDTKKKGHPKVPLQGLASGAGKPPRFTTIRNLPQGKTRRQWSQECAWIAERSVNFEEPFALLATVTS
jgi:hypothetical protein